MSPTKFPSQILRVIALCVALVVTGTSAADEPEELVRLRGSFNSRVRALLEPLVLKYKVELEKIEKKLAAEGRLDDALRVREVRRIDVMEAFTAGKARNPMAEVGKQKSKLRKALENSVWTMYDQGRFKDRPTYLMLQPGGNVLLWDGRPGTWEVTGTLEVEIKSASWGGNSIQMKLADDARSYDGIFTTDKSRRHGKLVAAGVD